MENDKVKIVKKWKTSTKIKEVESFLRFTNFYRHLIKNFSHIAKPLNKLKSKKYWKWEEEYQKAFKELKEKIISQPVLALFRMEGKFRVETDALEHAIEEVLSQEQEGKWKKIVFLLRIMKIAKKYLMDDKQDSISSCRIMISFCNTF